MNSPDEAKKNPGITTTARLSPVFPEKRYLTCLPYPGQYSD